MKPIETIRSRLENAFDPLALTITDESHKHVGHAGAADGRGHYKLDIQSEQFDGLNSIKRHRLIYAALGDLMQTEIHALSIVARDSNA